ncbi:zona pellucida sperm-binding protein 4-like [Brienomyrus brachyistius]|uniref:zona pellucida sperm-binding protein 4-like n=1 Tax=Brienomyrus brachyistius TaxID=42636 RepID=UPI0020B2BA22|nr:zona pellucida sperm-binding protein 4-like [Brienomyrus brachyistius]
MAWRVMSILVLLLLSWICIERTEAQQLERMHRYHSSFSSDLLDEPDDVAFYPYPDNDYDYPKSKITTHLRDLHNAPSTVEYFSDGDLDSGDAVGPALIKEIYKVPLPKKSSEGFAVFCSDEKMTVRLPSGPKEKIKVQGSEGLIPVVALAGSCGYSMKEGLEHNTLTISFKGCHVTRKKGRYTVKLVYSAFDGQNGDVDAFCTDGLPSSETALAQLRRPQSDEPLLQDMARRGPFISMCRSTSAPVEEALLTPATLPQWLPWGGKLNSDVKIYPGPTDNDVPSVLSKNVPKVGCKIPPSHRLPCGPSGISASFCSAKGCCVDLKTSTCFYPMDACTADKNFVFAVGRTEKPYPVDPSNLVVAGKDRCSPVVRSRDFAIFKFSVTECGTRSYMLGDTVVYMAEIQSNIKVYNLKYGAITRDAYFRLLVECRYSKSGALGVPFFITSGYVVRTPSWPSTVTSSGLYNVQLRIATDQTYTKFYSQDHLPLKVLLGKSVFLELYLGTSDGDAVLLVQYCVAYPRSATNALVLIHEGCPNKLDGSATVLYGKGLPQAKQRRRFQIKTFQFLDLKSKKFLDEEIYFMCHAEVCLPSERSCDERCFGEA